MAPPQRTASARGTLQSLPDDLLLRIITLSGSPGTQLGTAHLLGALSLRFREFLHNNYLPSLSSLSNSHLSALSLSNPENARLALVSLFSHTVSLRSLSVGACAPTLWTRMSLSALASAAARCLSHVNLAYSRVTDEVVAPLLFCPRLTFLSLLSCNLLTGSMFVEHTVVSPLVYLDLSWVEMLSMEAVRAVAKVSTLKELRLTGIESVNARTVRAFGEREVRWSLRAIGLSYCPLRDSALMELVLRLPRLNRLTLAETHGNVWGTGYFTEAGIEEIRKKFPRLQIVFMT